MLCYLLGYSFNYICVLPNPFGPSQLLEDEEIQWKFWKSTSVSQNSYLIKCVNSLVISPALLITSQKILLCEIFRFVPFFAIFQNLSAGESILILFDPFFSFIWSYNACETWKFFQIKLPSILQPIRSLQKLAAV